MKTKALTVVVFLSILCEMPLAKAGSDRWDRADRQIRRLQPEVFNGLPQNIRKVLKDRGCTIPQSYASSDPHNVISGQFRVKGQQDWAVLCSIDSASSIVVFWDGDVKQIAEIAKRPDKYWLQEIGDGNIAYSRNISTAASDAIGDYDQAGQGQRTAAFDHDGINDTFLEKGLVVYYWHDGNWLELIPPD